MAPTPADRAKAMRAVSAMQERYHLLESQRPEGHTDFDNEVMKALKLKDATPNGTVTWELYISPNFSNLNDVLHGGATALIFDMATTTALCPLARPGHWEFMGGVTRTLSISYLRPVPLRSTVRLHSHVVSVGKTMAMLRGVMMSEDGEVVYATAEHHKVNVALLQRFRATRVEWDEEFEREWGNGGEKGGEKIRGDGRVKAKM